MYIGIDGGGTKTDMALCDGEGRVRARIVGAGSNVSELGMAEACARLGRQLKELTNAGGVGGAEVRALYAGLAGGGNPALYPDISAALREALPGVARIGNGSDAINGLYACLGARDGMVAIAGTGSGAFVRRGSATRQIGARGYLIDDAGGGYWIGRAVLDAAYRGLDGRGRETALQAMCEAKLASPLSGAIPIIYGGGKSYIASFAPLAFEAAEAGDAAAAAIVARAADELALLIEAGGRCLEKPPYSVALTGGLWEAKGLRAAVAARLGGDYELLRSDLPPVYGAVVAALKLAGGEESAAFRANFAATFRVE